MTQPSPDALEEVAGDVLVLFHFQDTPVPRGALGRVDWILSGAVSRLAVDGKFSGGVGSAVLFPPAGKFRVERILVLGLGPHGEVDVSTLQAAGRHLTQLLDNLRARDIRIVLPEAPHLSHHEVTEIFAAALRHPESQADTFPTITFLSPRRAHLP